METKVKNKLIPTSSHWGNYLVEVKDDSIVAIHPSIEDSEPSPIGQSLVNALDDDVRIPQPMVRKSYLADQHNSDTSLRGVEPFVPVTWERAWDLAAAAIERVRKEFGNQAIYGGSYGWASAGRFHHANSQLHRFLNVCGGYTDSVDTYSSAAAEVVIPHVVGVNFFNLVRQLPTIDDIARDTKLMLCFGGISMKNTQIMDGGIGAHTAKQKLTHLKDKGVKFINVSPVKDDMADYLEAEWLPCRPNADVAIMLAIAHTLVTNDLHDKTFLDTYTVGFEKFLSYLLGETDGIAKDTQWAAELSEIAAEDIERIARQVAAERSLICISWSLQRSEAGEQTYWMATVLASMLGYFGLPGAGVAYGYGCLHNSGFGGRRSPNYKVASLPRGPNPVKSFIPVARVADMLLHPGQQFNYNGQSLNYPDIKLVYWAGGNPFHHHQDLNRFRQAWQQPETIIVNDPFWTATAKHADIVFPCTTALERNDVGMSSHECFMTPMPQAVPVYAQAKNDFDIFSGITDRLGLKEAFTENKDAMTWVKALYEMTQDAAKQAEVDLPDFNEFWQGEQFSIYEQLPDKEFTLEKFRVDPIAYPLATPSGKIEIFSEEIASFAYEDCIGHPKWYDKLEWLGSDKAEIYPMHLISNQPKTRLHSQYDHGVTSRKAKIQQRAPARMHPNDAEKRNIEAGDVVRLYNDRGSCLAGVELTETIREGVIELETGAWYDPLNAADPMTMEIHGNPNVLTRDVGTSQLAQGPTAHSCLVQVEKFYEQLPEVRAFKQPEIETDSDLVLSERAVM